MRLFKCIAKLVSENHLAVKVLTSLKNSSNMQKGTLILFFHHSEPNWARKSYFEADLRFYICLIKRWLRTTSISEVIERNYTYQLKANYLKNHKSFAALFFSFLESTLNLPCSDQERTHIGQVFLRLLSPKDVPI